MLSEFGAIPVQDRYVIDRGRATGGGVTAGIDFGLAMLAEFADVETAQSVQLAMEYAPHPPFDAGTPDSAPPEIVDAVVQMFAEATQ
jgi:cyclohexyl-isocyanide hydratase